MGCARGLHKPCSGPAGSPAQGLTNAARDAILAARPADFEQALLAARGRARDLDGFRLRMHERGE
jgi:hypothetical protein